MLQKSESDLGKNCPSPRFAGSGAVAFSEGTDATGLEQTENEKVFRVVLEFPTSIFSLEGEEDNDQDLRLWMGTN